MSTDKLAPLGGVLGSGPSCPRPARDARVLRAARLRVERSANRAIQVPDYWAWVYRVALLRATTRRPAHNGHRMLCARARRGCTPSRMAIHRCSDRSGNRQPTDGSHGHPVWTARVRTRRSERQPSAPRFTAARVAPGNGSLDCARCFYCCQRVGWLLLERLVEAAGRGGSAWGSG